eukprot:SAG25_NODE_287_length_10351_cov_22.194499_8_plen_76_part_00
MIWKLAKRAGGRVRLVAACIECMAAWLHGAGCCMVHGWAEATTLAPSAFGRLAAAMERCWSGAGAALLVSVHSSQ